MTESTDNAVSNESFIDHLKSIPWCKQGEDTLVAVYKGTPEIVEMMKERPVKIFPGGMQIKSNKSWLTSMQEKFEEGLPVPMVLVWRPAGLELWYRRHKSWDFPYDSWADPIAAAYEREQVHLTNEEFGATMESCRQDLVARAKSCPPAIPKQ